MLHPTHVEENTDLGATTKIAAILIVLAVLCGLGLYVIHDSGMWAPQPGEMTSY
jgi:hypothetical protein